MFLTRQGLTASGIVLLDALLQMEACERSEAAAYCKMWK
jgi:hypothetical protein